MIIFRVIVRLVICLLIVYEVFFCLKLILVMLFYVDVICIVIVIMMIVRYGGLVFKIVSVEFYMGRFVFEGFILVVVFMSDVVNYMVMLW